MGTTAPPRMEQVCNDITEISDNQFRDAIRHYELDCGITANQIVEMNQSELVVEAVFVVRDDEEPEEVDQNKIAVGWHLFQHPEFTSGAGWTQYTDVTVCPTCVLSVATREAMCPYCSGELHSNPSMPDVFTMREGIEFDQELASLSDLEETLSDVFGTSIPIQ